jgi:hypothetical protein
MDHVRAPLDAALVVFVLLGTAPLSSFAETAASAVVAADSVAVPPVALAATTNRDDLGPTSDPPWNPPHALPPRQAWEQVLLFPGAVVSAPFKLRGVGMDRGLLYVEQTSLIPRLSYVARSLPQAAGVRPGLANLGDRTGLGLKLEAQAPFLKGNLRNSLRVIHQASLLHYHRTELRTLGEPLALDYTYEWRPRERFYGIGMGTSEDDKSDYASHWQQVKLSLQHAWNREEPDDKPRTRIGVWLGPRMMVTRRGRDPGLTSTETRFPALVAPILGHPVDHLTYGGRFNTDWRVGTPHWSSGWRLSLQAERFDRPVSWLALHTGRADGAQFTRFTYESENGYSFYRDPRTIRFLWRVVDQGVTSGTDRMMFGDLATLGGRPGLQGFAPGRFHDLDLALGRVSYVFPLSRFFEMDLHAEGGGVFHDIWRDARLDRMEHSFGVAVRGRTPPPATPHPLGLIGLDFSREAVRVHFTLGNPD